MCVPEFPSLTFPVFSSPPSIHFPPYTPLFPPLFVPIRHTPQQQPWLPNTSLSPSSTSVLKVSLQLPLKAGTRTESMATHLSPHVRVSNPRLTLPPPFRNARLHGRRLRMGGLLRQQRLGPPSEMRRPDPAHRLPLLPQQNLGIHASGRVPQDGNKTRSSPLNLPSSII